MTTMRTAKMTTILLVLVYASVMLSGCFKDPITGPVDGTPVDPKPVVVMQDSIVTDLLGSDDFGPNYTSMIFSNRAPFMDISDSSFVKVDTSGAVPRLSLKASFSPQVRSASDAKEVPIRSVQIQFDSLPITGDDWMWMHEGQFVFTVRTAERPVIKYSRVPIQLTKPPVMKDEPYARVVAWKLTNRKEIVMKIEAQCIAQVTNQGGGFNRDRFTMFGTIRIPY